MPTLESVLELANSCEGVFLYQEKNSSVFHHSYVRGLPGLLVLQSSVVCSFFLRMYHTVDLATPNVSAISLMGLF